MSGKSTRKTSGIGSAVIDRVSVLSAAIRRASFMGAAATALVAGAPLLYSRAVAAQITTVSASQAATITADSGQVQDLLSVPLAASVAPASESVISLALNETALDGDEIVVNNDAVVTEGVVLDGEVGDVTFTNTGDVSGGIDINTGEFRLEDSAIVFSDTAETGEYVRAPAYDLDLYPESGGWFVAYKATRYKTFNFDFHDANSNDATIRIQNDGTVRFTGERGINTKNESGSLIEITNSGDVISEGGTADAVGIFADTTNQAMPYSRELVDSVIVPGVYEYTYALDWQGNPTQYTLHKVIEQGYQHYTYQASGLWEDRGDIIISNSGTIDLGADTRDTTGILTASPGNTTIDNSGDITVGFGRFAKGIQSYVQGETTVYNSGTINFQNGGSGIDVRVDKGVGTLGELYNGGDITVVNTGDIIGGVTREEFLSKDAEYIYYNSDWNGNPDLDATGMFAYSFGSNGRGNSAALLWRYEQLVGYYERYDLELPTEGPLFESMERAKRYSEGVEVSATTLINAGNITLGDGATGVKGASLFGELNLINSGTITVGDGATNVESDTLSDFSAGMSTHAHYGSGVSLYTDIYMLNEAGGIITTGDDGIGMAGYIQAGTLDVVNRGDIIVGDGLAWEQVYYGWSGTSYQQYFAPSYGIRAMQPQFAPYTTQGITAYNAGTITTGDMSHGIAVSRRTRAVDYYPGQADAAVYNFGSVTTGDNSTGISIRSISDGLVYNSGDITIGSRDDAPFRAVSEEAFPNTRQLNQGIRVRSQYASYVVNDGSVTTGYGTAGIYSRVNRVRGQSNVVIVGENGSVTTGDASTGVFMMGGGYGALENAGNITVGDYSIGVDSNFFGFADRMDYYGSDLISGYGGASIVNSGDIIAGNQSIGVSMFGAYYQGFACPYDPYGWSVCDPSMLEGAQLVGVSSLVNRGTIRVGDGSTAVEMTGLGGFYNGYQLPQLVNYGEISAGDNGIAIKLNTVDMLAARGDKPVFGYQSNNWEYDGLFGNGPYPTSTVVHDPSSIAIDSTVVNYGTIQGNILLGAGNDTVINGRNDSQVGTIVMNDNVIDFDAGGYGAGSYNLLVNSGRILVSGDGNLINAVSGIYNGGEILGEDGAVLRIEGNAGLGVSVGNYGTISSGLIFGDGDDLLVNSFYGGAGNIVMNDSTIDFGGGYNTLYNLGGTIKVESGDNLITGASVLMAGGLIDAVNGEADSSLTIDGNLSGDFVFAADIASAGTDKLRINGDVGQGSAIGVALNPTEQMGGTVVLRQLIRIDGENGAGDVDLLGVTGDFADTVIDARLNTREDGRVELVGVFGMGHLSTATSAATTMLQNYWIQSVSSFDQRSSRWLAGSQEGGISVWGGGYHNEGDIKPDNALQNTDFDQLISGTQFGLTYTATIGGATLAVGPNFSEGQGRASMSANTASASADAQSYGINASVTFDGRFYLDAAWQRADMDFRLSSPNSAMPTSARTEGSSTGFNLEAGYRYTFESGLGLSPQLQYATVDADLDDFSSTEGLYRHTEVGGKASRVRAGVSLFKTITSPNGHITPLVNVSYVNATDGESRLKANDVSFENTATGAGYDIGLGLSGRYHDWDIGVRLGAAETEATGINLSTNVNVRYRW